MNEAERPVYAVVGPTGSGKTSLAVALAASLPIEVVSVDSRQVYRRMDIGTAKPTPSERKLVRHHLLDVVDPDESYNAGRFVSDARACLEDIASRGVRPVLVGGTGLYLKSLAEDLINGPPSDPAVRAAILAEFSGGEALHRRLTEIDPGTAAMLHPNDVFRVVRALEIHRLTGETFSSWKKKPRKRLTGLTILGLNLPRESLYRRLDARVDGMMAAGFLDETLSLLNMGYGEDLRSMQGIGYRQLAGHLAGKLSLADAVSLTKQATRNFAKRQMTWFRGMDGIRWIDIPEGERPEQTARRVLEIMNATGKLC